MKPLLILLIGTLASCSYLPVMDSPPIPGLQVQDHRDYIELRPSTGTVHPVGLMFWPGGLVDSAAYIPSLGTFAARGYRVVIAKAALNLAIIQSDKGQTLAKNLGGSWVAAGHSLGGTAACLTIHADPGFFQGLVLLAAYPTDDKSLASYPKPVLALTGEKDGLVTPEVMNSKKPLLPPMGTGPGTTTYVQIPGGNHAQFGSYGAQDKDGTPAISPQSQWTQMADALATFWESL